MEEDSTTDNQITPGAFDADEASSTTSTDGQTDKSADSSDVEDSKSENDNAPSDSEDDSANDEKSKTEKPKEEDTPAFDKDLDEWAEKAGLGKPESDRERKAMQVARDNQREFSRRQASKVTAEKLNQEAVQAQKTTDSGQEDEDPMVARLNKVEQDLATERQNRKVSEYFGAMSEAKSPVSNEEAEAMSVLLKQTAESDGKAGVDFLLSNTARWHKLAKLELQDSSTESVTEEAVEKAKREERERLAKKSQANGPSKSAKSSTPAKQKDEITKIWEDDNI